MRRVFVLLLVLSFAPRGVAGVEGDSWVVFDGRGYSHSSGSVDDFRKMSEIRVKVQGPFVHARAGPS